MSTSILYGANGICHTDTPRIKLIAGICLVSFVWKLIFSMWYLAICLIPLNLFITYGLFSNGVYSIRICISEMLYIPQDKWDVVPVKPISLLTKSKLSPFSWIQFCEGFFPSSLSITASALKQWKSINLILFYNITLLSIIVCVLNDFLFTVQHIQALSAAC